MTNQPLPQEMEKSTATLTRRTWLHIGAAATAGVVLLPDAALAQATPLSDALRAMSPAVTGSPLAANWAEPVTGLVGVILDSSKSLRALDLDDIEPASAFSAE